MRERKVIGIIQSNYLPWRGYFDFISQCDVFIFLDDIQYTTRDWRNRNQIYHDGKLHWIAVPVEFTRNNPTTIEKTKIKSHLSWQQDHLHWFGVGYRKSPYFQEIYSCLEKWLLMNQFENISELNVFLIKEILKILNIKTELFMSSELKSNGVKTEKLLSLVKAVDGTEYISGPAADAYLDKDLFKKEGIGLYYKKYSYQDYYQGTFPFSGNVTVLDLLFWQGVDVKKYITSLINNERII